MPGVTQFTVHFAVTNPDHRSDEFMFVTGSDEKLGSWEPKNALRLEPNEEGWVLNLCKFIGNLSAQELRLFQCGSFRFGTYPDFRFPFENEESPDWLPDNMDSKKTNFLFVSGDRFNSKLMFLTRKHSKFFSESSQVPCPSIMWNNSNSVIFLVTIYKAIRERKVWSFASGKPTSHLDVFYPRWKRAKMEFIAPKSMMFLDFMVGIFGFQNYDTYSKYANFSWSWNG